MGVITERLALIIDAQAGGALKEFDTLQGKALKTQDATSGLGGAFSKMGLSAEDAGKAAALATAGAAVGVALLAKGVVSSIGAFTGLADEVRGIRRVIGGSAGDSSRLVAEFHALGISSEDAQRSLFKLARGIGSNADALTKYGVTVARNADGTVNLASTLKSIETAYRGTADATVRADLVQAAFGRGGAALLPILGATADRLAAIDQLAKFRGQILSDSDLEKARQYKASLGQVGESFAALKQQVGKALLPDPQAFSQGLTIISAVLNGASISEARYAGGLVPLAIAQKKAAEAAAEQAAHLEEVDDASKKLVNDVLALEKSQISLGDAQRGVGEALKSQADAQRKLGDLERTGGRDVQAHADAEQAARQAAQGLTDARQRQTDATRTLSDALAAQASPAQRILDLQENIRKSALDTADAQARLVDATDRLKSLQAGATPDERARGELAVARAQQAQLDALNRLNRARGSDIPTAQLDLEQATLDLTKAEQDRADLQDSSPARIKAIDQAQRDLERSQLGLVDSTKAQSDAEKAAAGLSKQLADDVSKARLALSSATFAVESAVIAQGKAEKALSDEAAANAARLVAARDAVDVATRKVAASQFDVREKTLASGAAQDAVNKIAEATPGAIAPAIARLRELGDAYNGLAGAADRANNAAGAAAATLAAPAPGGGGGGGPSVAEILGRVLTTGPLQSIRSLFRAEGGPVSAGSPYIVGEKGPELFVPRGSGTIIPNGGGGPPSGLSGLSAGAPTTVVVPVILDGREIARVVTVHQRADARQGGNIGAQR